MRKKLPCLISQQQSRRSSRESRWVGQGLCCCIGRRTSSTFAIENLSLQTDANHSSINKVKVCLTFGLIIERLMG